MYVSNYMTREPVSAGPETSIPDAMEILRARHFRHLPIVDEKGFLHGMVTDRDIRSAYPSSLAAEEERTRILDEISSSTVSRIMSRDLATISPLSTIDDALLIFQRKKVGAIPVVDEAGKLVGIFSIRDLIRAYSMVFGLGEKGSCLVEIRDKGDPGTLKKLVSALDDKGIQFTRLVRLQDESFIYIRVNTYNIKNVHKVLADAGIEVASPDMTCDQGHKGS